MAPRILNLETKQSCQLYVPSALLLGKQPPVPIEQEAGQTPRPVRRLRRSKKSRAPIGNRTTVPRLSDS